MTREEMAERAAAEREAARRCREQVAESWERSDTDGFLSQWAGGLTANMHERNAEILENGGKDTFTGLYIEEANGSLTRVLARMVTNQWGTSWLIHDSWVERVGRKWVPTGANSRIQKRLKLHERMEWDTAEAKVVGTGHGLSGNGWVTAVRTGDRWGRDAVLCGKENQ